MTEEEADLIIKEQDKSRDEILKSLKNLEVHFRELFELKTKRIVELEEENAELRSDLNKAKNIIHKLLVLIIDRKWWNYQTIDEARFFMKE